MSTPEAKSANVTSVDDSASSQTLLEANGKRKGFWIYNDSTSTLYVKFGETASTTSWTLKLGSGDRLEHVPGPDTGLLYTGRVDGIWSANASGGARITEFL